MINVAIVGPSGSGKSSSMFPDEEINIKGLSPEDSYIINVSGKPLPTFEGDKLFPLVKTGDKPKRQIKCDNIGSVMDALKKLVLLPEIKNIAIDDAQYLQAFHFMNNAKVKGYDKFTDIGLIGFEPVKFCLDDKHNDKITFFMYHEEESDGSRKKKIKTSGKLIDQHITIEGLFTIVLWAETIPNSQGTVDYRFRTQTDGYCTAKSPRRMFKDVHIPNDLGFVSEQIRKYYGV